MTLIPIGESNFKPLETISGTTTDFSALSPEEWQVYNGQTVFIDDNAHSIILPNASGSNVSVKFVLKTDATSPGIAFRMSGTGTKFFGQLHVLNRGTGDVTTFNSNENTSEKPNRITFNGSSTGGKIGTWIQFTDIKTAKYMVEGETIGTSVPSNPLSVRT